MLWEENIVKNFSEKNRANLITKIACNNATYFLNRHHVNKFPVDIFKLCKNDGITLIPYSAPDAREIADLAGAGDWVDRHDSFIVRVEEMFIIFWNDTLPIDHQRFVIAKVLGYVMNGCFLDLDDKLTDDEQHIITNLFAINVLYPLHYREENVNKNDFKRNYLNLK